MCDHLIEASSGRVGAIVSHRVGETPHFDAAVRRDHPDVRCSMDGDIEADVRSGETAGDRRAGVNRSGVKYRLLAADTVPRGVELVEGWAMTSERLVEATAVKQRRPNRFPASPTTMPYA